MKIIKRIFILAGSLVLCTLLTACRPSPKLTSMAEEIAQDYVGDTAELMGSWAEPDYSDRGTGGFRADITGDGIAVYYISSEGDNSLYWNGTFSLPQTDGEKLILQSEKNASNTVADCICCESTKIFIYEDEKITFSLDNGDIRTLVPDSGSM